MISMLADFGSALSAACDAWHYRLRHLEAGVLGHALYLEVGVEVSAINLSISVLIATGRPGLRRRRRDYEVPRSVAFLMTRSCGARTNARPCPRTQAHTRRPIRAFTYKKVTRLVGLPDARFQPVYEFALGVPITDDRLVRDEDPYARRR